MFSIWLCHVNSTTHSGFLLTPTVVSKFYTDIDYFIEIRKIVCIHVTWKIEAKLPGEQRGLTGKRLRKEREEEVCRLCWIHTLHCCVSLCNKAPLTVIQWVFPFFLFSFFDSGSHYVVFAGLELTTRPRLASNLWSSCLSFITPCATLVLLLLCFGSKETCHSYHVLIYSVGLCLYSKN